jgi:hypothetical protein
MSTGSSLPSGTPASDDDAMRGSVDAWPLRDALISKRSVLVEDCMQLIQGFPIRVWDDLPTSAVIVPISNDSDDGALGAVLVIGLSIRRPFDDDYESFIVSNPFLVTGFMLIYSTCTYNVKSSHSLIDTQATSPARIGSSRS